MSRATLHFWWNPAAIEEQVGIGVENLCASQLGELLVADSQPLLLLQRRAVVHVSQVVSSFEHRPPVLAERKKLVLRGLAELKRGVEASRVRDHRAKLGLCQDTRREVDLCGH